MVRCGFLNGPSILFLTCTVTTDYLNLCCDVGESGRVSSERETMFMLGGGELDPGYGWDRLEMARLAGLPVVVAGVGLSLLGRLPAQAGMAKRALEINSEYNDFLFLPVQEIELRENRVNLFVLCLFFYCFRITNRWNSFLTNLERFQN